MYTSSLYQILHVWQQLLTEKLRKEKACVYIELFQEEIEASKVLTEKLVSPPVLAFPRWRCPCTVETYACDPKIGCVLLQKPLTEQQTDRSLYMLSSRR